MPAPSSIHTAIRQAAGLLGYFVVSTPAARYRIQSAVATTRPYRPAQALAVLADECMMPKSIGGLGLAPEELAERLGWSGPVPRRGVSPHQEAVLERLAGAAGAELRS